MVTDEGVLQEKFIVLTGVAEEEDGTFVSYCRELGTSSCGDTVNEALENLGDAIKVHLNALEEVGERERFLRERNIPVQTRDSALDMVEVRVPLGSIIKTYSPVLNAV